MKKSAVLLFLCFLTSLLNFAHADPWYTGPLLAPAGKTIPRGHINFEPYIFYTQNTGTFNRHWRLVQSPRSDSTQFLPIFTYGLTDRMDLQFSLPYTRNQNLTRVSDHIGDASVLLGFQVLEQANSQWKPNLRVTLQEILPSGRYDQLEPYNQGTDSTGLGSYQTALGFNFQHLLPIYDFYLRTRLCLGFVNANAAAVHGLSSYGGTTDTQGKITPGNVASVDLAGELSVTQNWVLVMEGYYFTRSRTHFSGTVGLTPMGVPGIIGHDNVAELSLAPAIEFNFSANYGIIAGAWFSTKGKDAPDFISSVIAFNAYF
ncbi:Fe-S protein (plasmid) [Legionella adelaidensis]|uniref:Fe-S protein n=1 Tax=Legionella adelaidensis TaxID=45056 RepID=A0A0W0R425_9GAMM|nr:hypothetical protein [Legionella adelaidensis]KTC65801.1 Fe-S protein [Legionella adelaidensis]VEH85229.1 Fe-S protein [Legionella adelaidensis]